MDLAAEWHILAAQPTARSNAVPFSVRPRVVVAGLGAMVVALSAATAGCRGCGDERGPSTSSRKQLSLVVAYGSEKKTWLEEQARRYEAQSPTTASGKASLT